MHLSPEQTLVPRRCDAGEHPLHPGTTVSADLLRSPSDGHVQVWVVDCGRHRGR